MGIAALALDAIAGISNARRGVAAGRFTEHLVGFEHGQVFKHEMLVGLIGHHQKVFIGDDGAEAFVCATDEALARAENI